MKTFKPLFTFLTVALLLVVQGCQDPLKDVNVVVSSAVIRYSTLLEITDGLGKPAKNVTVTITGPDAEYIYNLDGYKQFTLNDGLLGLGVHPKHEPTETDPVTFSVRLSGEGYVTQVIPVQITSGQHSGLHAISLLRPDAAPPGVTVYRPSAALEDGQLAETLTISTPLTGPSEQAAQITLPAGTQFLDENGKPLQGGQLSAQIINVDTDKEEALSIFPGGQLATTGVYPAGSNAPVSGVFNPAAVTSIEFFVDGQPVRRFSQPIVVSQQIGSDFQHGITGLPVQAGDVLDVYSYTLADARWVYEREAVVSQADGQLYATFEIDHLSWYLNGNFTTSCPEPTTVTLQASWFDANITYPLTVEAVMAGKVVQRFTASVNTNNNSLRFNDLPADGVSIRVMDDRGAVLAEQPLAGCGGTTAINLADPETVADPTVTLQLYVRCPGQKEVVDVIPTFYLYYRQRGTGMDWEFLGIVVNGFISTKMLIPDENVRYDFKAVWGNEVKIVGDHAVKQDNSGTVGTEPGDIIGEHAGATNLAMLSEKCDELLPQE